MEATKSNSPGHQGIEKGKGMKTKTSILLISLILAGCSTPLQKADQAYNAHDYGKAYTDYLALAQGGDSTAEARLGYMYYEGQGVTADPAEAQHWYEKSATDGNDLLARTLAEAYLYRVDADADYADAFKWYKVAADRRDPVASLWLSVFYENGLGVARDQDTALHYLDQYIGKTDIVGQKTYFKFSGGDNIGGYMAAVQQVLAKAISHAPEMHKYPSGTVVLSFHDQDGHATDVKVDRSTGKPDEDADAVSFLQKADFPPVLPSLSRVERYQIFFSFGANPTLYQIGPAPQ
jgi:TonB family protein